METLSATEPHYIRCVKPNNTLKPAIFENVNVIQQLRCGVSLVFNFLAVGQGYGGLSIILAICSSFQCFDCFFSCL